MSTGNARLNYEFWNRVEGDHFYEDILVPVLADNSLVRHSIRCLPFLESRGEEDECKSELEHFLTNYYGLPPALSEAVFELCEDNIKLNEDCAIWVEPHDQT